MTSSSQEILINREKMEEDVEYDKYMFSVG